MKSLGIGGAGSCLEGFGVCGLPFQARVVSSISFHVFFVGIRLGFRSRKKFRLRVSSSGFGYFEVARQVFDFNP